MNAPLAEVLSFVAKLEEHNAVYRLFVARPEAIMVEVAVPGERWEIEFHMSGEIEIERFRSSGEVGGADLLAELWRFLN